MDQNDLVKDVSRKQIIPNNQNLTLTVYFACLPKAIRKPVIISAPKEELIQEIARQCGKSPMTARRWVYGHTSPCLAEKQKIAELLQCPVDVLFPPKE